VSSGCVLVYDHGLQLPTGRSRRWPAGSTGSGRCRRARLPSGSLALRLPIRP